MDLRCAENSAPLSRDAASLFAGAITASPDAKASMTSVEVTGRIDNSDHAGFAAGVSLRFSVRLNQVT